MKYLYLSHTLRATDKILMEDTPPPPPQYRKEGGGGVSVSNLADKMVSNLFSDLFVFSEQSF